MPATRVVTFLGMLVLALGANFPRAAHAHYTPMSFLGLVGVAEQIVVGRITVVEERFVRVRVEDIVVGMTTVGDIIRVRRFHDWACAWRWAPYEADQRVLLFIVRDKLDPDAFRILGHGCEGESRVVGDQVEPNFGIGSPGTTVWWLPDTPRLSHPLAPLCSAIADCRATYRFSPAKDDRGLSIVPVSNEPAIRGGFRQRHPPGTAPPLIPFAARSPFHQFLADEIAADLRRIEQFRASQK